MIVRIDSDVKDRFNKLARVEGKTSSQMVRELIEDYIKAKIQRDETKRYKPGD
jgi:predicted DNA-binding protein